MVTTARTIASWRPSAWLWIRRQSLWTAALLLLLAFLVLYPLAMLLYGSFRSAPPILPGEYTVAGYRDAFLSASTYSLLGTTLWLAAARTVLAVAIATVLAWLIHRTDMPWRSLFEKLIYLRFFLPLLPMVMAWALLLSPKAGLINQLFTGFLGFPQGPFNIFSYAGIIFTGTLSWVALLYIFLAPAFQSMDASLEEASRMSGASSIKTMVRVTFPLMAPAILATTILAFVRMIESFEVEQFLGVRAGIYVFSTKIYDYLYSSDQPHFPPAMALATVMLVITFLLVVAQWRVIGKRDYTTITGKGYRPDRIRLGRWGRVACAGVLLYIAMDLFIPLGVLIYASFMRIAGVFMKDTYTLQNYSVVFNDPETLLSLKNTVILGLVSATVGMILCTLVAYVATRSQSALRRPIDLIAWVPWTVPGIVLALGLLWAYMSLSVTRALYGTLWLLILAFIVRGLPLGTRSMTSTMVQVSGDLEASSRLSGAGWTMTLLRIWLPLLRPSFLAGWIILFSLAVRTLDTVILLYSPESRVLATSIYKYWSAGQMEKGIILGLAQAALTFVAFFVSRLLIGRRPV